MPSWDLFLGLFFAVGVAYGLLLARDRIVMTLVATYLALVATLTVGDTVIDFFQGNTFLFNQIWLPLRASPFIITTGLFVALIVLLMSKAVISVEFNPKRPILSFGELIAYAFLSSGLIVSSIISFMPKGTSDQIIASSQVAKRIVQFHDWWIVIPVLLLIVSGFRAYSSSRE